MFSSGITSGFVALNDNLLVRIIDRINSPTNCMKIEFLNVNKQTKSPIVGNQWFDLIQDRLYNGRPAWSNGDTFLSYVPSSDDDHSSPGTWLVGNEPGVDSGFAYLKPKQDVFVPIGMEGKGGEKWHWLERSGWEKAEDVRLVCKDEIFVGATHYFHIEYFDHGHATSTILSPPVMNTIDAGDVQKKYPQLMGKRFPSLSSASLWNADKDEWIPIITSSSSSASVTSSTITTNDNTNQFNVICHFGAPTMITDSLGVSTVGHLISQEHGENDSWKLTFRRIVKERMKWDTYDLVKTSEGGIEPNTDHQKQPSEIDLESPAAEEILFNLDGKGQARGGKKGKQRAKVILRPLTDEELQKYHHDMLEPIQRVQKGHFVWVWYSTPVSYSTLATPLPEGASMAKKSQVGVDGSVVSTNEMMIDTNDGTSMQRYRQQQQQQQQQPQQNNNQSNPIVETSIEMLLECVARYENKIIFTYHYADRRDVMRQSMLSKDTQYFVATIHHDNTVIFHDFHGKVMNIDGAFFIGNDLLGFIRRYLVYKDGTLADLSSCYLYHAGVSLPVSLVYAAEIVCVLMGAKAMAMIQYSTPSDHQWKFPLVAALARAVAQAPLLLNITTTSTDSTHLLFDVELDTFTYGKDETLIIYRTNRRYLVDSLVPLGKKAQALHPLPYPDDKTPYPDWQEQIYNAWWNGYILGYPERFIDSYCETFHNGLTVEERMVQARRGKIAVKQYLAKLQTQKGVGVTHQAIGMGIESPISEEMWSFLATLIQS